MTEVDKELDPLLQRYVNLFMGNTQKGEHVECEYYEPCLGSNVCRGNEPYKCSRAKKEGLCHIKTDIKEEVDD